jgi:molybdopterin/thiamine biosynthesis adenylyltransferase
MTKIDHILVCGAGAAGSNFLLAMLCSHPALSYSVLDFDKVEARNIEPGTQPYSKVDLNRPKVQALQRIAQVQREKRINAIFQKLTATKELKPFATGSTLIIDAFDNAKSRNLLFLQRDYPVLHIGFSATMVGEAVWNESYSEMKESKADAEVDVCEMHLARPFIQALTGMAAITAADFIDSGKKNNLYFDRRLKVMVF